MMTTFRAFSRSARSGFALAAIMAASAFPMVAQADDRDDEAVEQLSAVGVARGLELYDRDAADLCGISIPQIRVTVHNVTEGGILKLELFGEKDFMKKSGKLRRIRVPADEGPQEICINVPEPGEYAVVGYHDQDGDRKLDKKWNFKPKEPYGLSNNPKIESLRLPKWDETRFDVPMHGAAIDIYLVDLG